MHHPGPRFDRPVARDGYAWWYLDAVSDDASHGITVIAFIGSVFSPYYAWARRRGATDPCNHCALNVALYNRRANRWSMTERGASQVQRQSTALHIGSSCVRWSGAALSIDVDEFCAPLPRRLRGSIRLMPTVENSRSYALDHDGLHRWTPYAPLARVEVEMREPALRFSGSGYFDSNDGDVPLEETFREWTWSRAALSDRCAVLYDTQPRGAAPRGLSLQFSAHAEPRAIEAPVDVRLPATRWRMQRHSRTIPGRETRLVKTLEDAPFYSRSLLSSGILGQPAHAVHESLSLDRFRARWVQCLLPFRMPRIAR